MLSTIRSLIATYWHIKDNQTTDVMHTIIRIPGFTDNYFWLITDPTFKIAYVIDPGDAAPVKETLQKTQLSLAGILLTHHHADHIGGVTKLLQFSDVPVYGPKSESIPTITHPLLPGKKLELDDLKISFQVLDVKGHTAGHIAYYSPGILFCGDTLFAGGCGRIFEGDAKMLYESLRVLASLPEDTSIYCAHEYTKTNLSFAQLVEPDNQKLQSRVYWTHQLREQGIATVPSLLKTELETNPFLRSDQAMVKSAAESKASQELGSGTDVFRVIREWKDAF